MNGKLKLSKQDDDSLLIKIFSRPWPYWIGGVLLGVINIIYLFLTGEYWAVTTGFTRVGAWALSVLGVEINTWEAWNYYSYTPPWLDIRSWSNLGIILGALLSVLLAGRFKIKRLKNKKQFLTVLFGGWLMGYGARVSIGCNIGGLYSAISSLSLNGWLYLPFVMLGVFSGSKILANMINY